MDASARQIIRVGTATADRSPGGGRVLEGISATPVAEQRDCLDFAVAETNRRHADLWLVHGCEPEMLGRRATHLGGVARNVLDRSPCPVIVTPPVDAPGGTCPRPPAPTSWPWPVPGEPRRVDTGGRPQGRRSDRLAALDPDRRHRVGVDYEWQSCRETSRER
jgi:hypothetical protein